MILELALCVLSQTAESKAKVEAVALLISRDLGWGENEIGPFNQHEPGTKVAILVSTNGGGILELDRKKSKLVSMKDDKGSDLLAAKPKKDSVFSRAGLSSFPKIAQDGKSCVVEAQASGVPAKGARSILLEGSVSLLSAQGQETVKPGEVELRKGAQIKAGALDLVVQKAAKDGFDERFPFQVSLSGGKGGRTLAKVRFLDAAGKEIESRAGGTSRMSGFGEESWTWDFHLKSEVKACAIEVTLWKGLADVTLPFQLEVSLGF